ncbi:MAG: hypothetical protein E7L01_20095 [Paenibacillus macerans]|uniref:Uncharacterized protein n=1 Tax=Paenibacillus macerans TaxID=44252 RepID=A0A090ZF89_PAEMA|nr:hypothetical protein [Paenibacillus macerans]KFN08900.1 hypothetical protein DJ90_5152 [Paenibacillus macerans]MBS5914513.1 hypothetical protein [Paenibacillus macerans]MCY7561069.1 hypothetical protein [Paenibacillus macerans]MDU5950029.1 hypothetical protein [Paenibacillus macerans]MDU7475615.1 hypothetical protein [Paenibacillus macerans]
MSSSRNHQEAHGIGQAEEQLNDQAEAAVEIQGQAEIDRHIKQAVKRPYKTSAEDAE